MDQNEVEIDRTLNAPIVTRLRDSNQNCLRQRVRGETHGVRVDRVEHAVRMTSNISGQDHQRAASRAQASGKVKW